MTPLEHLADEVTVLREILTGARAQLKAAGFEGESLAEQLDRALTDVRDVEHLRRQLAKALLREDMPD